MNLEQHNTLPEVGRKFVFWVVYDTTSDRQFIKMDSDTGCLAMFDNEESAEAFASGLVGVGYKEVVLYQLPPETSKKTEEGCDLSDLVKRLRIKAGMIEMGELIAWGSDSTLMREAADALEQQSAPDALVEALESLIKGYVGLLEAGRDRITSLGGDCDSVAAMEQTDPWLRDARKALATYRKQGGEA